MIKQNENRANLRIRNTEVAHSVEDLDNLIRAEYNTTHNFLEYYAGKDSIGKVSSVKNQVIYGRRGTGKTHLLRALQETLMANSETKCFPVYIDVRSYKPLLNDDNPLYYALITFKELIIEILKVAFENVEYIYNISNCNINHQRFISAKRSSILGFLEKLNVTFHGDIFSKIGNIEFSTTEIKNIATSLKISYTPEIAAGGEKTKETKTTDEHVKYISFSEMSEIIKSFVESINIDRLYCLIDEWSEIPVLIQPLLAELLKRAFITLKITIKIAAIPNRTRLMIENRIGLEDGGDIFGYSLDNRFIYELHPDVTKKFFNELLFNQLNLVNPNLYKSFIDKTQMQPIHSFLNMFLANQALREILIASAGIPRDFLSIFIGAYNNFINRRTEHKHLAVTDIRTATVAWYEVDKKKAVESNHNAKVMLDKIIKEIIVGRKRCHFIIPEKYETNTILSELIDLRIIHLRKRGISHKGNKGVSYNVYYLDYACYTSSNIFHNRINSNLLNEIETIDDFREIRRVSLEDKFFDNLNAEIGNSFKYPHCGMMVDTTHPAYIKQEICNNCFEKVKI